MLKIQVLITKQAEDISAVDISCPSKIFHSHIWFIYQEEWSSEFSSLLFIEFTPHFVNLGPNGSLDLESVDKEKTISYL